MLFCMSFEKIKLNIALKRAKTVQKNLKFIKNSYQELGKFILFTANCCTFHPIKCQNFKLSFNTTTSSCSDL